MDNLVALIVGFYAIIFIVSIIIFAFKIRERIKEKSKDDDDLKKFDKY